MSLIKIESAPCWPITLEEARRHLAIDSSTRDEDSLIEMLIQSASTDAEMKTGRIFVKSKWVWNPDTIVVGEKIDFPTCPVTEVKIFDTGSKDEEQKDIASSLCDIMYPSPEPQGSPMLGWILPISEFPEKFRIELTVGYPYEEREEIIEQKDAPTLVVSSTKYTSNKIHIVFNREVTGDIDPSNFSLILEGSPSVIESCYFEKGGVTLSVPSLNEGVSPILTFTSGFIYDQFNNYVQPILGEELPPVIIETEENFIEPSKPQSSVSYISLCPTPIKQWILVRTGTLYCQRSEIALRAGKSNDALFPDGFINNLLAPYRTRFN